MIHPLFDFWDRHAGETRSTFLDLPYMHQITGALEQCITGDLPDGKKNLAIAVPPRCFKTTITSQILPAWCLTEIAPDCEFIMTSATAGLATSNAMATRRVLTNPWVLNQYPFTRIDAAERDLQHFFRTTMSGAVYAAGLGGTITGFGAGKVRQGFGGAIIIDDPMKAVDARSKTIREKVIDYYNGTLKSRRNAAENTPIIVIMQRLHPDDLIGYLMKTEPEDWHLVTLPARTGDELLNPVTLSHKTLDKLQEVDPFTYFSQYMGTPVVEGGNIIKLPWWRFFDPEAQRQRGLIFITADTAFKEKSTNDASVMRVWEGTKDYLYCLDAVYGRWDFPQLLNRAKDLWEKWSVLGAREFWVEDKASGTPLVQTLTDVGVPAQPWVPREFDYPEDKVGRMNACAWSVHGGRILLPTGNEEIIIGSDSVAKVQMHAKVLMEEAAAFSADMSHTFDDHCDTLTMADSLWKNAGGGQ